MTSPCRFDFTVIRTPSAAGCLHTCTALSCDLVTSAHRGSPRSALFSSMSALPEHGGLVRPTSEFIAPLIWSTVHTHPASRMSTRALTTHPTPLYTCRAPLTTTSDPFSTVHFAPS